MYVCSCAICYINTCICFILQDTHIHHLQTLFLLEVFYFNWTFFFEIDLMQAERWELLMGGYFHLNSVFWSGFLHIVGFGKRFGMLGGRSLVIWEIKASFNCSWKWKEGMESDVVKKWIKVTAVLRLSRRVGQNWGRGFGSSGIR